MSESETSTEARADRADEEPVLVSVDGPIVRITLNRPERRNALNGPLADRLAAAVEEVNADPAVSVVVLRGAGGAFCSGLDLKQFAADPPPAWVASFSERWQRVHRALFDSDKILVGALERAAVNGGAALALACDFLIAGRTAFLQVGEIQQGMAAPMNLAWLRLRHSEALAARVALLGDRIGGPALEALGLAHEVVDDDAVIEAADRLAARLAGHDQAGVRRIKTMVRRLGVDATAEEWFGQAVAVDPGGGHRSAPVAARRV